MTTELGKIIGPPLGLIIGGYIVYEMAMTLGPIGFLDPTWAGLYILIGMMLFIVGIVVYAISAVN